MANFRYSTDLVIPQVSSIKDDVAQEEINYIFNALRTLATRIDEATGALAPLQTDWPSISPALVNLGNNIYRFYARASATISYGMFVNFYNLDATHVQARPAQANAFGNIAGGYCVDPNGVVSGQFGEFQIGPGLNYGISGLTPGNWYFISPSSPGLVTATQPTTPGQVIQLVGIAITDRIINCGAFNQWIQL